ncbi:MAG: iron transporter [Candidatus Schekmanbacteria bacterium]|nr:iron transporter [Candidatus Schekmanbacteria bacterium]
MKKQLVFVLVALSSAFLLGQAAAFVEYPIGLPQVRYGMEIAAVYLQPIQMDPEMSHEKHEKADVHLEADIHASTGNPNGFGEGEWIPYLTVTYKLTNLDTGQTVEGTMMPMVASDGPHYGDNVIMPGVGRYQVEYTVDNPRKNGFGRHTDKATGVRPWFPSFAMTWEFEFLGLGKGRGY